MDYEIQYKMTIDYVDRILEANKDILDVYRVCVPFRVSTCTSMYQSFWRPWEDNKKDIWVRSMPKKAMKKEDFPFTIRPCGIMNSRCVCAVAPSEKGCGTHLLSDRYPYAGKF